MLLAVTARQHPLGPSEALFEQHLRDDTERYVNQTEINAQVRSRGGARLGSNEEFSGPLR